MENFRFDGVDCFEDSSKADEIILDAIEKLQTLMTDKAKELVTDYTKASSNLDQIRREIYYAKAEKKRVHEELERAKSSLDDYKNNSLPRELVQKMAKAVCGDFAPGDEAWIISCNYNSMPCSFCHELGEVSVTFPDGSSDSIRCPKCSGYKKISWLQHRAEKTTIAEIHMKLCFSSDRVSYWDKDTIRVSGSETRVPVKNVFKTEEEAQKRADEMNEKERNK